MSLKRINKSLIVLLLTALVLTSCGGAKAVSKSNDLTKNIVKTSKIYLGSPYKYGGTSRRGFDCSGLVYTIFKQYDYQLPRSSYDMSKVGKTISANKAKVGDLIFFKTNPRKARINHVGIITKINKGVIYFIHSSTKRGVIESNMAQKYYKRTFVKINTVLQ